MIIIIDCEDQKGLIHKITGVLAGLNLNITENREFVEKQRNRFLMRTVVEGNTDASVLRAALEAVLPIDHSLLVSNGELKKMVIMVTKEEHCLTELISKYYFGNLKVNLVAVIG